MTEPLDHHLWLSAGHAAPIEALMRTHRWCRDDERVASVEKAGEGNMNVTLRVSLVSRDGERTVILKQSRPWVAKYPSIAAPLERAEVERRWYAAVDHLDGDGTGITAAMPRLLGGDSGSHTLLLEDLGPSADFTGVYRGADMSRDQAVSLAQVLRRLHDTAAGRPLAGLDNLAMRALNHAHLFEVPMDPLGGPDLDAIEPGLLAAATTLRGDAAYRGMLAETGRAYLNIHNDPHATLLHGDYFPGSWLRVASGVRVIDPEFGFRGPRPFDVGVALAHLLLANRPDLAAAFADAYGPDDAMPDEWVARFAATEVMRRLIGVAQLPLREAPAGWRAACLRASREAMLAENWRALANAG